ncbi:sugar phosphate nucleotidyltransferase [Halalkalicoccus sp. NIPERK01]|uniref:sugar phosphate nucleotidyltransferase n=1 Tax=Halalkalicoccus sp. NIPERK01 TaxID=3053469 RepID=UPI00256EB5F3|nr:sugar phosphate nucleotidyltransferase [Halalkalicoccus sp. NIPERK01]MDL5362183.1 sugar phosphate nucleotidyltransferase [Halalkalicoccus sp. NIPERK01]
MDTLPAVVLAAGEGKRLRPLTRHRPKPMLPAANKPILAYVFDGLIEAGVSEITVVVGYGRSRVQDHFGPTYRNVPLTYVVQEKQLGSGHALLSVENRFDEPFLVVYGDQILDAGIIEDVIGTTGEGAATLGVLDHNRVEHYGGVIMHGDRVVELVERPTDERKYRLNAGVYGLGPRIFEAIRNAEPRDGEHSLIDALSWLVDSEAEVRGTVTDGLWVDATYPWDLLEVTRDLTEAGLVGGTREARIDDSAIVHETATIRDPVVIGADAEVGAGTVLGPYTCLGENVTVESSAVVEGSLLDSDTRVGPNATLVDCVTGQGVHIGAGVTVPGGPGDVRVGDRVFERERLGALFADRVEIGGASSFAPGTMVGPDATVRTGAHVDGPIAEETEVR